MKRLLYSGLSALCFLCAGVNVHADILSEVEHGFADSHGVKIHYATVGEGPLVVMIHGP